MTRLISCNRLHANRRPSLFFVWIEETLALDKMPNKQSSTKDRGDAENANKDRAEAEYTVSNWDSMGRAKLDQLQAAKAKVTNSKYEKWASYDRYLLETHLVNIRTKFSRQERQRNAAEEAEEAADAARARRAEKRQSSSGGHGKSAEREDETYQRRDIQAILLYFVSFQHYYTD